MTNIKLTLGLVFGLSFSGVLFAGNFFIGHHLKHACSAEEQYSMGICKGFIMAVHDSLLGYSNYAEVDMNDIFCTPEGVDSDHVVDTVTQYMEKHPEDLAYIASQVVIIALQRKVPCN